MLKFADDMPQTAPLLSYSNDVIRVELVLFQFHPSSLAHNCVLFVLVWVSM
jgi:hypothetical protein